MKAAEEEVCRIVDGSICGAAIRRYVQNSEILAVD